MDWGWQILSFNLRLISWETRIFLKQNCDVVWRLQQTSRNLSPYKLSALQMSLPLGPPQVFKTTLSTLFTKGGFKTHQALRLWDEDTIQRGKDKCEAGELLEWVESNTNWQLSRLFENVSVHRRKRLGRKRGVVRSIPRSEGWRCSKHELDSCLPVLGEEVGNCSGRFLLVFGQPFEATMASFPAMFLDLFLASVILV